MDAEGWYRLAVSAETIQENAITAVTIAKTDLIVTRLDGEIVAFSAECPHAAADLTDGTLHRGRITCPDHEWKFDIKTGRTLWPEDESCRLKRFDVQEREGALHVRLNND